MELKCLLILLGVSSANNMFSGDPKRVLNYLSDELQVLEMKTEKQIKKRCQIRY